MTPAFNTKLIQAFGQTSVTFADFDASVISDLQEMSELQDNYEDCEGAIAPSQEMISKTIETLAAFKKKQIITPRLTGNPPNGLGFVFPRKKGRMSLELFQEEDSGKAEWQYFIAWIKHPTKGDGTLTIPFNPSKLCDILLEHNWKDENSSR